MSIGDRIKEARLAAKYTQKELAQRAGVAVITVQQYEGGKRQPKIEQLQKIATALDISMLTLAGVSVPDETTVRPIVDALSSRGYDLRNPQDFAQAIEDGLFDESLPELLEAFETLNETGRRIAIERIKELAKIPEYQLEYTPSVRVEYP